MLECDIFREEKAEIEGILEETTRENIDMSNYRLEAEALRDAVTDLQGQLEVGRVLPGA